MSIASVVYPHCHKVLPLVYDDSLSYYEMVCKLRSKVNEVIDTFNEYESIINELSEALVDINEVKASVESLEGAVASINETYKLLSNRVAVNENAIAQLQEAIGSFNTDVYKRIDELERELTQKINNVSIKYYEDIYLLQLKLNQMKLSLQAQIDELNLRIDELDTSVINPWHSLTRINQDVNMKYTYSDLADLVPRASEYAGLGLTADEYAEYQMTAQQYAEDGRKILRMFWVYSPTYGFRQEVSNVLTSIINYVSNTLTADEYSLKDMTADEYSALDINAQEYYYWRGEAVNQRVIFNPDGTGLTKAQYRHLGVEADNSISVTDMGTGITSEEYNKLSLDANNNLVLGENVGGIDRATYERLEVVDR